MDMVVSIQYYLVAWNPKKFWLILYSWKGIANIVGPKIKYFCFSLSDRPIENGPDPKTFLMIWKWKFLFFSFLLTKFIFCLRWVFCTIMLFSTYSKLRLFWSIFKKFSWLNWYLSESHVLEFFFPLSEITYSTDPSLFLFFMLSGKGNNFFLMLA